MNEIVRIDNLLKLLRRGSWTLTGEETLAFGQVYQYFIDKKNELSQHPVAPKPIEIQAPVVVVPSKKGKK